MSETGSDREERAQTRWKTVQRYARLVPPSCWKPMRCMPTQAELNGEVPRVNAPGNDNKVIYDTRDAAESCAAELQALGAFPQRSYPCPRHKPGHDGHWHLTTDGHAARRAKARGDAA